MWLNGTLSSWATYFMVSVEILPNCSCASQRTGRTSACVCGYRCLSSSTRFRFSGENIDLPWMPLLVCFPHHGVEASDDGNNIRYHDVSQHCRQRLDVDKRRRADFHPPRVAVAVAIEIKSQLTL